MTFDKIVNTQFLVVRDEESSLIENVNCKAPFCEMKFLIDAP